ncbi:MAG TPA: EAL domain-containing protein [Actinoplanes sp.]|nr:EAL domain-containing protein [Actinoplanes sp.]
MASDSRAYSRYVWAGFSTLLGGVAYYVCYLATGAGSGAISYVFVPVGAVIATLAVLRLYRSGLPDPAARRFWRTILIGFVLITAGYAGLAADMLSHYATAPVRSMPLAAAGCAGFGLAVVTWAVAGVPAGVSARPDRRRLLRLDRAIAFLGCGTLLWHFGVAPMVTADEGWSTQATVLVGLASVLAVGGITKVSYLTAGPVDRLALRLIAAIGLTAAAVAVVAVRFGAAGSVPAQALVMPIAPVLATLAVRSQWRSGDASAATHGRDDKLLPYLALAAVAAPLIAVAAGPIHWSARSSVLAAVAIGLLVSVRQFLTFRENARLLREKRASEERLRHEVTHDGLTGLANRALFHSRLAVALEAEDQVTVLLVDLDDFKTVNDSLGHDVGDRLLVSVAGALRDRVGTDGLPVRVGGDEFAVLLTGDATSGECLAQRLLDAFGRPIGADRLLVQASIGVAAARRGTALDTVLRHADVAMYAAKQRGKAGYVCYVPGMEQPVLAHMQLGGELRRALDSGEFRVHYQPVIGLDDGRVIGIEALVRWQHPTRGMVPPGEFIPAAERTGLIVPLGRWVLRESCGQAAAWLAEFGPDALQKIAPNVSARQLHDPDFVRDVRDALRDHGLSSDRLVLELTESAVLRGQQVSRTLHELDGMGVKLALDDFGTGESSLSLLRSFPAAIVKLDKSFVDGIEIEDGNAAAVDARQAVARAVIQLAGALRLDAVAEGIENGEQVRRLRELGYTLGQGFHLARPMPAEEMTRMLAVQNDTRRTVVPAN